MLPSQQERLVARRHQLPKALHLGALPVAPGRDSTPHTHAALRDQVIEPDPPTIGAPARLLPSPAAPTMLPTPLPTLTAVAEVIRLSPLTSPHTPPLAGAQSPLRGPTTPTDPTQRRSSLRRRPPQDAGNAVATSVAAPSGAKRVRFVAGAGRPPPVAGLAYIGSGASIAVNGMQAAHLWLSPSAAVWAQQGLFVVPALLGPVAMIRPSPSNHARCMALTALGASLGLLLAAACGEPSMHAPLADTLPCILALALSVQTSRRVWRERRGQWPARPLARALRATLPLQLLGPGAYVLLRTAAAAPDAERFAARPQNAAPAPAWPQATALPPHWEAACVTIAALTTAAMLHDGNSAGARRVHQRRNTTPAAMLASATLAAAAFVQAGILWRRAALAGSFAGLI